MMDDKFAKNLQVRLDLSDDSFSAVKAKLAIMVEDTQAQLVMKLKGAVTTVPDELGYIVRKVVVKQFNRSANEGMTSYGQEGQSISYEADDFAEFADDIDQWLADNATDSDDRGKIRFINPWARKASDSNEV